MEERLKLQRIEICNCSLMIGVAPGAEGVGSVWMDYKEKATKQLIRSSQVSHSNSLL